MKTPAEIVEWALLNKSKNEDTVEEMTSPGVAMYDKLKTRIESKPVKDQLAFYKSFADKLQSMFIEETPSAESKFTKFMRDIKSSFMDMIGGEEDNGEADSENDVDDMEDEEESFSDEDCDTDAEITDEDLDVEIEDTELDYTDENLYISDSRIIEALCAIQEADTKENLKKARTIFKSMAAKLKALTSARTKELKALKGKKLSKSDKDKKAASYQKYKLEVSKVKASMKKARDVINKFAGKVASDKELSNADKKQSGGSDKAKAIKSEIEKISYKIDKLHDATSGLDNKYKDMRVKATKLKNGMKAAKPEKKKAYATEYNKLADAMNKIKAQQSKIDDDQEKLYDQRAKLQKQLSELTAK